MAEAVEESIYKKLIEEGREKGREEGRKEGREEGRKEGRKEGREEGREEGKIQTLLTLGEELASNNIIEKSKWESKKEELRSNPGKDTIRGIEQYLLNAIRDQ